MRVDPDPDPTDDAAPAWAGSLPWTETATFRALVARSSDVIMIGDGIGNLVWVSPSIERTLGYTADEVLGSAARRLLHPDDAAALLAAVAATPDGEASAPVLLRAKHRDGTWRHFEVVCTNLLDDPLVRGIVSNSRDVTDRVEAEQALRHSEASFRALAAKAPVGIVFSDADHKVTYVNDTWLGITGIDRDDVAPDSWARPVHPDDFDEVTRATQADLDRDGRSAFTCRMIRTDGTVIWVRGQTVQVLGADGAPVAFVSSIEDVTAAREAREREVRWGALVEHSQDLVSMYDADGRFVYASPSHERILGYTPDELLGTTPVDLLHPDERDDVAAAFAEQLLGSAAPAVVEHRYLHRDGSWRYLESIAVDLMNDPTVSGILVNARDVTDRRRTELVAKEQARILDGVARGVPLRATLDAVVEMVERWSPGGRGAITLLDHDTSTLRVLAGPSLDSVVVGMLESLRVDPKVRADYPGFFSVPMGGDGRFPEAAQVLYERGFRSWWACPMDDPAGTLRLGGVMLLRRDEREPSDTDRSIIELGAAIAGVAIDRDRAASRLAHQARHDALTGLPNREQVVQRLHRIASGDGNDGSHTAVLFLDLDRFKVLNDSVGHDAGDRLLVEMGDRLQRTLRPGDLVARFGGDEFVMVCERLDDQDAAVIVAERVLEVVREPFVIAGNDIVVTASIGIAMVDGRVPPEDLLRDADAAMYSAKAHGRARVELFNEQLRDQAVARLDVERELRHALDHGDLTLHYQPVVRITDGAVAGFEALLRWDHPSRGLLHPSYFLAIAEECGLMRPIGAWVRDEACRQAVAWRDAHPEWGPLIMGFNLSAGELIDPQLGRNIERTIDESGIDPALVSIEITERLVFEDERAARELFAHLHDVGVLLALDDFGTGYSPLVHLKEFPVQAVKIDRSFVSGLGRDPFDDAIVEGVIGLAHRLDLFSIAEGVETAEQAELLVAHGCFLAQGFHFARPLPAANVETYLEERHFLHRGATGQRRAAGRGSDGRTR